MTGRSGPRLPGEAAGEWALTLGVVALVSSFVPMIGEIVAVLTALPAITLGAVGVRRYETRQSSRLLPAVAGVALGVLAMMMMMFVLVATRFSP
ncbi:hypothetical protein [Actinotalea sp. K2]|uniref:hypothetical protein n=1 Tax=Actinotalea sp. K2 TaxID=2939438 RepID=UPI002016FA97|nr:hypothetical protein [Actinotalea sp. K2]MCL3862291.1 hypothetical protein [Actinotalea sp. K2]